MILNSTARERFESWYFDRFCTPVMKVAQGTYGGGTYYSFPDDERLYEAWIAALSYPSTPQGWKQIGWTCGEGDCGRIHESPGAEGSYAVPVYVLCPPTSSDPEWPDVSPEGLRKMAEIAAPNNARVFHAAADVIEALQNRGPRP